MRSKSTIVWGSGGGRRRHHPAHPLRQQAAPRWRTARLEHVENVHEPASAYASTHNRPMPMRWGHAEEIGSVVALRRAHGRLYAVAETEELLGIVGASLSWHPVASLRKSDGNGVNAHRGSRPANPLS
ncbi:MAG TPA: hypothetical protein VMO52_09140, partial [Acidimicrobiia bacterium]|nr:hypothetical protein [Acidimicrobiia bacterium]